MQYDPENFSYTPVPKEAERLFRMCWQLENWLRLIVYVELRAKRIDWETPIKSKVRDWPLPSFDSDKKMHHMATSHQVALSYLTFGQLWDIISSKDIWELFEPYFPPKNNVDVKIAEIKTIRNRTAHFREPHSKDIARLELFMADMESGIRNFCKSYTQEVIPTESSQDPVSIELESVWGQVGYGIELMRPIGWLYAPGNHRMEPIMNARLHIHSFKNNNTINPLESIVYRVVVQRGNRVPRSSNTVQLFESTKHFHKEIIHFNISSFSDMVSVTIPAILGVEKTTELIIQFLQAGLEASRSSSQHIDVTKLDWPEYVLWPNHMINIYDEKMQQPILCLE